MPPAESRKGASDPVLAIAKWFGLLAPPRYVGGPAHCELMVRSVFQVNIEPRLDLIDTNRLPHHAVRLQQCDFL